MAKNNLLPSITMAFFKRGKTTAVLWLLLAVFGIASYSTLLKREGFPSINIPIVIVNGSYAVDDPAKVDGELAKPLSDIALKQPGVSSVQASSEGNFVNLTVQYKEGYAAEQARQDLQAAVKKAGVVPSSAQLRYQAPYFGVTGGQSEGKVDATVSLFSDSDSLDTATLTAKAKQAIAKLNKQQYQQIDNFFLQDPYQTVTDPTSGASRSIQRSFDTYGERVNGSTEFRPSVIINVASVDGADVLKLDAEIKRALKSLDDDQAFAGYQTVVSASNAPTIRDSLSELQKSLLEGLLAVLIIGSIVIAIRASIITVISMLTVIAATAAVLYLGGFSLNVITLFAIILGLSLIVDDTIIMVEALDASRKKHKTARAAVADATRKISRAMVAATLTAALSFAPLLFIGGTLGSFIRAIPITIISALLISLVVALVFIPLFARFILLAKKQLGDKADTVTEIASGVEHRMARLLARPMLWAQHSRPKEILTGLSAVFIGIGFVVAAGFIFTKVQFNIFPPTKDTNQIAVAVTFPPETSVTQAESIIKDDVDTKVAATLGDNFESGSYYGLASNRNATLNINLKPYTDREPTANQLADRIDAAFKDFDTASVDAYQIDVGPPAAGFTVNISADDRAAAEAQATKVADYLRSATLTRPSGETARFTDVTLSDSDVYTRVDGKPVLKVTAGFDGTDVTTLTTLAQDAVKERFPGDGVSFDLGQEQENQDSFATLALAFPIVLLVIYLVLAFQFRSLLQPLLIFLAIPFSLFGVTLGLYLTDNSFSFFAMLGFFALIGLSIKNTILLTDYANQARRAGMSPIDAAVEALGERFRPLIATSLTAIVSLIPLAVTNPFWQGLAVVLIFGLASSTLLVLTVFPYYYLGAEYLRIRSSRIARRFRRNN